jgi:acyl-CoA thioesterase
MKPMTQPEQHTSFSEELRQRLTSSGYFQLIGLQIDHAQEGQCTVRIQVDERLQHHQKIVHGGVIFTLADTAMSLALLSALPSAMLISTIEAKINYLRPVRAGELIAEANIIHKGRTTAVLESSVYNLNGVERKDVARALGTFNIQAPKVP